MAHFRLEVGHTSKVAPASLPGKYKYIRLEAGATLTYN